MTQFMVEEDWYVRFDIVRFFKQRHTNYKSELTRMRHFDVFLIQVPDDLAVEFKLTFSEHILSQE